MPSKNKRKSQPKQRVRPSPYTKNRPRPQSSTSSTIVRGLAGIANQFIPGSGLAVTGVSKLLGFGAYTSADAERILASKVPEMHATLDRGVRIAHHEYLGDVVSSVQFAAAAYPINPGQSATFPWLSTVASAFQEYEINGCIFFFKSTSANALNSTNTALGQVIGGVQYNPYQQAPTSKLEMLALAGAADGKPSESNIYPVECKSDMTLMRSKLIRLGAVADDLAKYDHGNFYLGTNGSQAIATVGELHIVYDVWLKKPRLWPSSANPGWYFHATGEGVTNSNPIGDSKVGSTVYQNNLGVRYDTSLRTLTIPAPYVVAGTHYMIRFVWKGDAAASIVRPNITCPNATNVDYIRFGSGWSGPLFVPASGSFNYATLTQYYKLNASNTDTVFTVATDGTLPTTNCVVDIVITEIAPNAF